MGRGAGEQAPAAYVGAQVVCVFCGCGAAVQLAEAWRHSGIVTVLWPLLRTQGAIRHECQDDGDSRGVTGRRTGRRLGRKRHKQAHLPYIQLVAVVNSCLSK